MLKSDEMLASGRLLCLVCEFTLRIATRFLRFFGKVPKRLKSETEPEQECHAFCSLTKKEQTIKELRTLCNKYRADTRNRSSGPHHVTMTLTHDGQRCIRSDIFNPSGQHFKILYQSLLILTTSLSKRNTGGLFFSIQPTR